MRTTMVKTIIPSWEGEEGAEASYIPSYSVSLVGATVNVDGGTQIKMNSAPTHSDDYDVRCDGEGKLSGEPLLQGATKVYIWGFGYTLDGSYYDCESVYSDATEIEISEDTEIVLWGANSE